MYNILTENINQEPTYPNQKYENSPIPMPVKSQSYPIYQNSAYEDNLENTTNTNIIKNNWKLIIFIISIGILIWLYNKYKSSNIISYPDGYKYILDLNPGGGYPTYKSPTYKSNVAPYLPIHTVDFYKNSIKYN